LPDVNPIDLSRRMSRSAALKLLRSEHAPFVLALADEAFRQKGRSEVGEAEILERLAASIESHTAATGDEAEDQARRWLALWCDDDHRWMRRSWMKNRDERAVQLRPDTERSLRWMQELDPREFVGTESRFEQIVALLRQLAERTTADPEARIRELEENRDRIQAQIDRIRRTGEVEVYTEVQVKERLQGVRDGAGSLLGDFREVEERFREIGREVQERRLEGLLTKGGIVGDLLDADAELRSSPQGQSFESFHRLLLAPGGQDELLRLVDKVVRLPEMAGEFEQVRLLRELLDRFLASAERIEGAVRSMAGQIRRVLDERRVGEDRRARELVDEIRRMALSLRGRPFPGHDAHVVQLGIGTDLPLERPLWEPTAPVRFDGGIVDLAHVDVDARVDQLFQRVPVDLVELEEALSLHLEASGPSTLGAVLAAHPVRQGLPELVGWLKVCAARPDLERSDDTEIVEMRDRLAGTCLRVRIPRWRLGATQGVLS
jgi:hypothetical protein